MIFLRKKIKHNREPDSANSGGFSLMEVILAIFILLTVLTGLMSMISDVIRAAAAASSKLIAANLAQEGIEVVKNIRDLNYKDNGWNDWYASFNSGQLICYYLQYDSISLDNSVPCGDDAPVLKYDLTSGLYGYTKPDGSGMATDSRYGFKRKISLQRNPDGTSDNEIAVVSSVSWTEHGRTRSVMVEDRLWNWR